MADLSPELQACNAIHALHRLGDPALSAGLMAAANTGGPSGVMRVLVDAILAAGQAGMLRERERCRRVAAKMSNECLLYESIKVADKIAAAIADGREP